MSVRFNDEDRVVRDVGFGKTAFRSWSLHDFGSQLSAEYDGECLTISVNGEPVFRFWGVVSFQEPEPEGETR